MCSLQIRNLLINYLHILTQVNCHNMGATGYMLMPEDDPTRLILVEPSVIQTKYIHLILTTVPLTVENITN